MTNVDALINKIGRGDSIMITFQANLYRPDAPGTWTYVEFPFSVEEKFGVKGRVPVKTIEKLRCLMT